MSSRHISYCLYLSALQPTSNLRVSSVTETSRRLPVVLFQSLTSATYEKHSDRMLMTVAREHFHYNNNNNIYKKKQEWECFLKALLITSHSLPGYPVSSWWCHRSTVLHLQFSSCVSLHAVGLVQRVVEEGLRGGGHGGERSQRGMDGSRRGRGRGESGRRCAGREAVAEVASGRRRGRGVGVLLQCCRGVVAIGGAVVQVRGGERCCCGAELGLQHQAGLEERLRVHVLLGEPGHRGTWVRD